MPTLYVLQLGSNLFTLVCYVRYLQTAAGAHVWPWGTQACLALTCIHVTTRRAFGGPDLLLAVLRDNEWTASSDAILLDFWCPLTHHDEAAQPTRTWVGAPLQIASKHYVAVHSGTFDSIGIVRVDTKSCQTCNSKRYCRHPDDLKGVICPESAVPFMSLPDFEKSLNDMFDFAKGQRKLRCISREQIPERLEDPAYSDLLKLYKGNFIPP